MELIQICTDTFYAGLTQSNSIDEGLIMKAHVPFFWLQDDSHPRYKPRKQIHPLGNTPKEKGMDLNRSL